MIAFWAGLHTACCLAGTVWLLSSAAMDLPKRFTRIRNACRPIFISGRALMYPVILGLIISTAFSNYTWQWVIPALFALNLYLSYLNRVRKES